MRQVGDWDLGHFATVLAAFLNEQQIGRNNNGLKITGWAVGEIMNNKIQKKKLKKNPTATFEDLRTKAMYCACSLHLTPPKGWADHLSHPSSPTPDPALTLTPCKEPARSTLGSKRRNLHQGSQ